MEIEQTPSKFISFFNHKGGVSKTTTTFAVAWEFAAKGYTTLMVDTDAQCNLSQLILQTKLEEKGFDAFYNSEDGFPQFPNNVKDALLPIIDETSRDLTSANLYEVANFSNGGRLYLFAGHPNITKYEDKLAMAYGSGGMIGKNCLGAFFRVLELTTMVPAINML